MSEGDDIRHGAFDRLESRLDRLDEQVDRMDGRVDRLARRISKLEGESNNGPSKKQKLPSWATTIGTLCAGLGALIGPIVLAWKA